jgi:hypothetical protein
MIIFDLKCAPQGHVFEAWFGSSRDFDDQRARGLVSCPLCGSGEVAKAPMAPAVPKKGNAFAKAEPDPGSADPATVKKMMAALAAMQKEVLKSSEHVGDRFADEARAIHLGDAEARAIHGQATSAQAESLIEDGIPVSPLPFSVVEPGREN